MPVVPDTRIVDAHVHVFSSGAPAVSGARYRPAYAARLEALRALWRTHGVTHGVIVQPSFFGTDNTEMLAAVATDRAHLRGVAVVDPTFDVDALARLADAGVVAIRLNLRGVKDFTPYGGQEWRALYGRAAARAMHLECFMDAGRVPELVPLLRGVDMPVVFDHFANPGTNEASFEATFDAVARLADERFVCCKLSGPYRLEGADRREIACRWLDVIGPDHLVWGSDWPWTSFEDRADYRRLLDDLRRWVPADRTQPILWDNAARLYRFG